MAKQKRVSTKGFGASENKSYMKAMQELRRSSASSPHVSTKNKGSRAAKRAKAISEEW